MTNGLTVLNRIFSNWNSFPVMDKIPTCLHVNFARVVGGRGGGGVTWGQFRFGRGMLRRRNLVGLRRSLVRRCKLGRLDIHVRDPR
jgi:hypothetical protein